MAGKIKKAQIPPKFKEVKSQNPMILTHKIQELTVAEIDAINEEFGHWDDIEHLHWVAKKIAEKSDSYSDAYMKQFQFLIDQEARLGQYAQKNG